MCVCTRVCAHVHQVDGHSLTRPRLRSFRNIRPLVSIPSRLFLSHSAPFVFFDVPSEPHAHGCARLKIWNQCDQNGCYGRAPVYRTVAIRPEAGPDKVTSRLTIAPSSPRWKPPRETSPSPSRFVDRHRAPPFRISLRSRGGTLVVSRAGSR